MTEALLVREGFVYTADDTDAVHPGGSVLAVGGRITAVGPAQAVAAAVAQLPADVYARLQVLDARGMMVLPGLVNGHWHDMFAMRVPFKGALRPPGDHDDEPGPFALGGDVPKLTMLFDKFTGLADRLTDEEADAVARYSLWTQLRSGSTTVADTGSLNRPDRLAAAATALGVRCSLTTWAADAVCPPGADRFRRTRDTDAVLAGVEDLLRRYPARPGGLLRVRPSALYVPTMTDELGRGLAELVGRYDTGFVTHVAALRTEPAATRRYFGETPVRRLATLGLLSDRLMAVHCGFVDDDERKLLLAAGAHISHSPAKYGASGESTLSETRLIRDLVADGGRVSLSTDGAALPLGGLPEAMRAAWQTHNEFAADPTRLPPSGALAMATRLAARGLRWDDETGSLAVGKQADLVLVKADDWRYLLNPRPLEAFLNLGGSSDVDTVVVGGRVRLRGGRHVDVDEQELRDRYLHALRSFSGRELGVPDGVLAGVFDGRN